MIDLFLFAAFSYVLTLMTWVFYLAVMKLIPYRNQLSWFARINAYILLAIGLVLDVLLNVTVGSALFLEPPHPARLLLTARLSNHVNNEHGWRTSLAKWLCAHLLDQFDPSGSHCK